MTHGEIWWIDFGFPVGSLPSKKRPAVIMQNDLLGIKDLNTAVVIPFTTNLLSADYEPNILFSKEQTGLSKDSVAVIHHVIHIKLHVYFFNNMERDSFHLTMIQFLRPPII